MSMQEKIKKELHQAIDDAVNPRNDLHQMYKQKMKSIIEDAIFCFCLDGGEEDKYTERQQMILVKAIIKFTDQFVEEFCIMDA